MKTKILAALAALVLTTFDLRAHEDGETKSVAVELREVIAKVQAKLKAGAPTEAELAPELQAFDDLLAKHKDEKTDEVANILFMKATLYAQVLKNETKGDEVLAQLQRDFPETKPALAMKRQAEGKKVQANLVAGKVFPDFNEPDTAGKPLSIGAYKGKVVLVDFWATWCRPCVEELPNVIKAYEKHHAQGFEIIGISLDQDKKKLETFVKQKQMPWPQFFDGKGWQNKLAQQYGVNSIPATYLLDREGNIIAKGLRGEELEAAVAAALAKK